MGFTHYIDQDREATTEEWQAIRDDVATLIAALPEGLEIAGLMGERGTPPELNNDRIAFNGVEDEGCETFILCREPADGFCKTNQRPYDLLVAAALIVATHHAPAVYTVRSDGHDFEWSPALSFVRRVLREGYELPPLVASNDGFVDGYRKPGEPGYDRARAAYEQEHGQAA